MKKLAIDDFEDLTNITRAEFHMLRDGFDYEQDGERKHFGGVFEKYRFNASIAEFVAEKKQRADYFKTDEDIFELIPNQKNNQIFTPRKVVKMMVDGLEKEQSRTIPSHRQYIYRPIYEVWHVHHRDC
jgi:type II restriction enzyme